MVTREQLETLIQQTNMLERENMGVINKLINVTKKQVKYDNLMNQEKAEELYLRKVEVQNQVQMDIKNGGKIYDEPYYDLIRQREQELQRRL